jgi:hypothetical protein
MSGITLSIFPSPDARGCYQLHAHLAGADASLSIISDISGMIGLTRVCQQIHAETQLLPFQTITFHIQSDGSFVKFIDALPDAQRDAIVTIQMSTQDAYAGGVLWHRVVNSTGNDLASQQNHLDLLEWSFNLAFDRLAGLKRVRVEEDKQWVYLESSNYVLHGGISNSVKGRGVDIDIQT